MFKWSDLKITTKGTALLDRVLNNTALNITFDRVVLSSNEYAESELYDLEQIENIVQEGEFLDEPRVTSDGVLEIRCRFTNENITDDYTAKTYGLYASFTPLIADENDASAEMIEGEREQILFAVMIDIGGQGLISAYNGTSIVEKVINASIKIDNSSSVNINIASNSIASKEYIDSTADELKAWVRLNGGVLMDYRDTNYQNQIRLKKIYVVPTAMKASITLAEGETIETY